MEYQKVECDKCDGHGRYALSRDPYSRTFRCHHCDGAGYHMEAPACPSCGGPVSEPYCADCEYAW